MHLFREHVRTSTINITRVFSSLRCPSIIHTASVPSLAQYTRKSAIKNLNSCILQHRLAKTVMELNNDCISMAMALDISMEGKVICDGHYPYNVLYANRAWTKITGYEQHEVMVRTLALLHGPRTDSLEIKQVHYKYYALYCSHQLVIFFVNIVDDAQCSADRSWMYGNN